MISIGISKVCMYRTSPFHDFISKHPVSSSATSYFKGVIDVRSPHDGCFPLQIASWFLLRAGRGQVLGANDRQKTLCSNTEERCEPSEKEKRRKQKEGRTSGSTVNGHNWQNGLSQGDTRHWEDELGVLGGIIFAKEATCLGLERQTKGTTTRALWGGFFDFANIHITERERYQACQGF